MVSSSGIIDLLLRNSVYTRYTHHTSYHISAPTHSESTLIKIQFPVMKTSKTKKRIISFPNEAGSTPQRYSPNSHIPNSPLPTPRLYPLFDRMETSTSILAFCPPLKGIREVHFLLFGRPVGG